MYLLQRVFPDKKILLDLSEHNGQLSWFDELSVVPWWKQTINRAPGMYQLRRIKSQATKFLRRSVCADSANQLRDDAEIIHGYANVAQYLEAYTDATFNAFIRDPLERTISHYLYWSRNWQKIPNLPDWFQPFMSFEEFVLHPEMINYQHRFLCGDCPDEKIDPRIQLFAPENLRAALNMLADRFGGQTDI